MGDDRRGGFRGGRGGFRPSGPREMHKATCADCGQETEVPFQPSGICKRTGIAGKDHRRQQGVSGIVWSRPQRGPVTQPRKPLRQHIHPALRG